MARVGTVPPPTAPTTRPWPAAAGPPRAVRSRPPAASRSRVTAARRRSRRPPRACSLVSGQKVPEVWVAVLELTQRARLDLSHTLARDPDLRTHLLERGRLAIAEAEPGLEHVPGALVETLERFLQPLGALAARAPGVAPPGGYNLAHFRGTGT